jgi:hypothetical protein
VSVCLDDCLGLFVLFSFAVCVAGVFVALGLFL